MGGTGCSVRIYSASSRSRVSSASRKARSEAVTSVVVSAALARAQSRGGHVSFMLQYLLGFRRLGLGVTFVDRVDSGDADVGDIAKLLARHDEQIEVAVLGPDGESLCGLDR